jgi:hypothetical protein
MTTLLSASMLVASAVAININSMIQSSTALPGFATGKLPGMKSAAEKLPGIDFATGKLPGMKPAAEKLAGIDVTAAKLAGVDVALDSFNEVADIAKSTVVSAQEAADAALDYA